MVYSTIKKSIVSGSLDCTENDGLFYNKAYRGDNRKLKE
jgi:hypothetical protein